MIVDRRRVMAGGVAGWLALPFQALPFQALAQGGDALADRVDLWAKSVVEAGGPGFALGVWQGGRMLIQRGYGLADLESARAILPGTPFHVASVSKQFAAMAIGLLAAEGKVDIAADIRTYLPWMPDFGTPVRVEHLIHHVSGLRDQWTLAMAEGLDIRDLLTQARMKNLLRNQRALNFAPGSDYLYCNSGFTLLAEIVTVASGQTLPAFAKARFFDPLGMAHSHFIELAGAVIPGRAQSYAKDLPGRPGWQKVPLNYETWGATSLSTTVADLIAWQVELLHPRVLPAALVDRAAQPYRLTDGRLAHYGYGMQALPVAGRKAVSHSGADAGFRTFAARFPDQDAAIVVLRNDTGDSTEAATRLLDIYLPTKPPKPARALAPTDPRARSIVGSWYMEGSQTLTIAAGPAGLTMRTPASPPRPLIVYADDTFDNGKARGAFHRIHRDKAGRPIAIEPTSQTPTLDGGPRYTPATLATPGAAELAAIAGRYRSAELDTTYVFTVQDGGLVSETLRGSAPLKWTAGIADHFDSSDGFLGASMRVARGADGRVTAIFLELGRSRKLQFDRVA